MISIPLMRNTFLKEKETKTALSKFIHSAEKLSMDKECLEFEKEFSKKQDRKHSILFNSGGSANLALLQALQNLDLLKRNDKVGFSAVTWSTNTMPIMQLGMIAVPVDCEIDTLNVGSKNLLDTLQSEELKAMFLTNVLGFVSDIDTIRDVCAEKEIILIEDNCESLGTETSKGKAGNFGLASTFSFFVAHHMSTIEGGMVCTDDDDLNEMLRIVRANGWDRNLSEKEQGKWRSKYKIEDEFSSKYTFYDLGYNLRPTEITGFLGRYQLQFLDENINKRESNFLRIEQTMLTNDDLIDLKHGNITKLSTFAIPVVCKSPQIRSEYIAKFFDAGIEVRPMIAGNMQRQPFFAKYNPKVYDLPNADVLHTCGFYCGNYPELTDQEIQIFIKTLQKS